MNADATRSLLSPAMIARLRALSLAGRRAPAALRRGRRRARRLGAGADFVDTRPYAPGDDPRRIHWSAWARLERLLTRLCADETPLRLALVVDTSASMAFGDKLWQARCVAAGLAAVALGGEDRVALVAASSEAPTSAPSLGGGASLPRLLAALEALRAGGTTDLAAATRRVADAARGRALCVLLSDFLDPAGALAGARAARARGHTVALVRILHPEELDPPDLSGHDLVDDETGEVLTLPPLGARERYLEALAAATAELESAASELDAPFLGVTSTTPFEDVVLAALRGGVLRAGGVR